MSTRRTSKTATAREGASIGAQGAELSIESLPIESGKKAGEQVHALTEQTMEKSSMGIFDRYEDLNGFSKDNVDALVKSSTALAKGLEDLGQALFKISQENMESTLAAAKSALSCTTLRQIVDFQNDLAKTGFDKLMSETSKVSELSLKLANNTLEPIQARVNFAVEKLLKPMAA